MTYTDAELYSLILRNMAEGVCLLRTSDLTIVYANPRFEQIFGYGPGELEGRPVSILNYAEDEPKAMAVARGIADELERHGEAFYEVHNRKKTGEPFWCRARASAFTHPEFGPVWVVVQADITAEKEAAERLRREEKLLSSIFELLPVGLWITDREGRILSSNAAGARIWGGVEHVGLEQYGRYEGWWANTGRPIGADEWALARAVIKGQSTVGELVRIRGFDGKYRTILNSAMPFREGDEICGAIAINEDVTNLMEAEALSAGVIAAAPDAIVATDGLRRIVVFNTGAERIFGHPREDMLGRDIGTLVAKEHRSALEALLDAAAAGKATEPLPLTGCRRSSEAFPAEVSAACTHSGILRRYTLVLRDITARVREEEERAALTRALADERSWLKALIATAPVGIATIHADESVTLNARAEEILGITPQGHGLEGYAGSVQRTDETQLRAEDLPLNRAMRGETALTEEYVLIRPDGSKQWISGGAAPVLDAGGRRIGAVGTLDDITTQKRLEADLSFLAETGRALVESLDCEAILRSITRLAVPYLADVCVAYLDSETGEDAHVSAYCQDPDLKHAAEGMLRRFPVRRTGPGPGDARANEPDSPPAASSEDRRHLAESPECREMLRRTGLHSFLTVPLRARGGKIGAMTLLHTGSGRTAGRLDLAIADVLGRRAGLAIDNARLYRAAQRATRARDDVLAIVAHDIRNPLTTIVAALKTVLLSLPEDAVKAHRAAGAIKRAADQINRLIGDLLDVAQIEAGTLSLELAPVAPAELVTEALEAARPSMAGLELSGSVDAGLPNVLVDRYRVLQVLSNLLGNAAKFTPSGGHVRVEAEGDNGEILISVRDTGPGIATEQLDHLFDRFWQGNRADRRGAGLGLAIVRGIVEGHGGRVWVESQYGSGATFRFTLPVRTRSAGYDEPRRRG